jgi:hypothetical protein
MVSQFGTCKRFNKVALDQLQVFQFLFYTIYKNDTVCLLDYIRYFVRSHVETEQVVLQNNLERVAVFHMVVESTVRIQRRLVQTLYNSDWVTLCVVIPHPFDSVSIVGRNRTPGVLDTTVRGAHGRVPVHENEKHAK